MFNCTAKVREKSKSFLRPLFLHVSPVFDLVEDFSVLVTDYDVVSLPSIDADLDRDELVVWQEESLRLGFKVVLVGEEVEFGHVVHLKVKHENVLKEEQIAVVFSFSWCSSLASAFVNF